MKKGDENKWISARILAVSLCLCLISTGHALGDSGITLTQNITMWEATENPPPAETRETVFYFKIENTNDVCNEEVYINKETFIGHPNGEATFLGFTESPGSGYAGTLFFELEDEHDKTIYFGVKTGEDSNGCDFHSFSAKVLVCDTGPHGFWDCDDFDDDEPCEYPAQYHPEVAIEAASGEQPTGTGTIWGNVRDGDSNGMLALIEIQKVGVCVPGEKDNLTLYESQLGTEKNPPDTGHYEAFNLPFGNYNVTAIIEGALQTLNVTLSSSAPSQQASFIF